ncbi:MAG: hypothetical protein E7052_03380 [Lentisphaerae bacterium]|nr:hypothetical protein [Lentisphaerota bacterium]
MVPLLQEKAELERWLQSAEGKKQQQHFDLSKAENLQKILQNSADPSALLEMVYDLLDCRQRKLSGEFFTPCNVAEDMVRNALDAFLKYNPVSALENIKVLDPACGAGEFLLAALKILLEKRRQLQPERSSFELTCEIVENNLYGIDCNANSVQLLRRRLNDLTGGKAAAEHFIVQDALDFDHAGKCFNSDIKFDLVVGNPPYVSFGLRNVGKISKQRAAELKKRFVNSAEYKITLYAVFMEFALASTAGNGINTFIVPDSFLCGQYFGKIRNFLLEHSVFEHFILIRKKLFQAVPGSLIVYTLRKSPPAESDKFAAILIDRNSSKSIGDLSQGYYMYQAEFKRNFRQRFRLFFDQQTHDFVRNIEQKSLAKLGDLMVLASGLIGRSGKRSIISNTPDGSGDFRPGITSGSCIKSHGRVVWQGEYINCDPSAIKSGLGKIDYARKKLFIRQTGDRIISAVDNDGLLALNNVHVAVPENPNLDLERLCSYLNSPIMLKYYQAITLEANRAMAQIDLETLRELPLTENFLPKEK